MLRVLYYGSTVLVQRNDVHCTGPTVQHSRLVLYGNGNTGNK